MKVAKLKKVQEKNKKVEMKESLSIKNFIITIGIILLVLAIFYFITTLVVKPLVTSVKQDSVKVDSNTILMSQIKSKKESEYYVLATKKSNYINLHTDMNYDTLYNNSINNYKAKEGALKVYNVNMDDALNSSYWGEEFNIESLTINDDTLFKVSNGEIVEYYIGHTDILNTLDNL